PPPPRTRRTAPLVLARGDRSRAGGVRRDRPRGALRAAAPPRGRDRPPGRDRRGAARRSRRRPSRRALCDERRRPRRFGGARAGVARDARDRPRVPSDRLRARRLHVVFPVFSDPEVRLHYTHAHNDLLQLGAEGGIGAWILLGLLLAALSRAAAR